MAIPSKWSLAQWNVLPKHDLPYFKKFWNVGGGLMKTLKTCSWNGTFSSFPWRPPAFVFHTAVGNASEFAWIFIHQTDPPHDFIAWLFGAEGAWYDTPLFLFLQRGSDRFSDLSLLWIKLKAPASGWVINNKMGNPFNGPAVVKWLEFYRLIGLYWLP